MGSSVTAIIYIGLSYVAFQFVGVVGRGDKYIEFFLYILSSCVAILLNSENHLPRLPKSK